MAFDATFVLDFLKPGAEMTVLDAGTGGGDTAVCIAPHVREVVAVDSCEKAISKCKDKVGQSGLNNVRPLVMPVESLNFPAASFDAITCRMATHHFDDIPKAIQELARVLKAEGAIVIAERLSPDDESQRAFLHKIGKLRDSSFTTVHTMREWTELLGRSGLKVTDQACFKETIDVGRWLDHSPLNPSEKEAMYQAFATAPTAVLDYFQIQFSQGLAVSYTDDKVVFRAQF